MDSTAYDHLAESAFRKIGDALENVDSDLVDYDGTGDVLVLTLRRTQKCVINTQRTTQQIWVAAASQGWHFSWNLGLGRWLDDKGQGLELFSTVARVIAEGSGVSIAFP